MFETANDWLLIKIFIDFLKVTKLCVNIVQINIAGNILLNEGLMFILAVPDNFIPTLYAADTSKMLFYNVHAALHFPLKNLLSGMFDMKLWHFKKNTLNHFNSELEIFEETLDDAFFYDDDVRNSGSVSIRTLTSV